MKGINVDIDELMIRIKDILIKSMLALQSDMIFNFKIAMPSDSNYQSCFQLMSFDLIIDDEYQPWLIDVKPIYYPESMVDMET